MILPGIIKLASGNAKGVEEFSSTAESFTASLAPFIAFPLVGAVITSVSGDWKMAAIVFFSRLCGVLVLPVLVYEFARVFGRKAQWLRTATALNWCNWLALPAAIVAVVLMTAAISCGLSTQVSEITSIGLIGLYLLWNRWFVLKVGLQLHGWSAGLILVASLVLSGIFSILPALVIGMKLAGVDATPLP